MKALITLLLLILLLLTTTSCTFRERYAKCFPQAIFAALTYSYRNPVPVRIVHVTGHVYAEAFIKGKWVALQVPIPVVQETDRKDSRKVIEYLTVCEAIDKFYGKWRCERRRP